MTFSVIIPCHNAGPWIAQALQSVAAQTYPPHEIIVINDASTDDSIEQIKRSGVAVTLLEADFRNGSAARNEGAKAATGDWLAFLDADDEWYPNHLTSAAALLEHSADVAAFSFMDTLRKDGVVHAHGNRWPLNSPASGLTACQCVQFWNDKREWYASTMVVQRNHFLERGGFDAQQQAGQDFEMWLRIIHGNTWSCNPTATARYRADTPQSVSRSNPARTRYFELRGLLNNRDLYTDCPSYHRLVQHAARSCVSVSLLFQDERFTPMIWDLAHPLLRGNDAALFRVLRRFPSAYRQFHRIRMRFAENRP